MVLENTTGQHKKQTELSTKLIKALKKEPYKQQYPLTLHRDFTNSGTLLVLIPPKMIFCERFFQIKYPCTPITTELRTTTGQCRESASLSYTTDLPTTRNTTIAIFADSTAFISINNDPIVASQHLGDQLHILQN